MKKIIGYRSDGKVVYEPEGICCSSLMVCQDCGAVLATSCGIKDIYCPKCALKRGLINENMIDNNIKNLRRVNT